MRIDEQEIVGKDFVEALKIFQGYKGMLGWPFHIAGGDGQTYATACQSHKRQYGDFHVPVEDTHLLG